MKLSKVLMKKSIGVIVLAALVSSCSQRVMDFTIVSSKNIDFAKFPTYKVGSERVSGKDVKPIIIIIPTGYPNGKEAMDRAIESVPGAVALVDGVLTYKYFYIPYIYGEYVYVIEGTPLIDPSLAQNEPKFFEDFSVCVLDESGALQKSISLSEMEYYELKAELLKSPKRTYRKLLD